MATLKVNAVLVVTLPYCDYSEMKALELLGYVILLCLTI
jgi:hypothetical protein